MDGFNDLSGEEALASLHALKDHHLIRESSHAITNYFKHQQRITGGMRAKLVSWLVEVCNGCHC
jgi:cyclin-like protein